MIRIPPAVDFMVNRDNELWCRRVSKRDAARTRAGVEVIYSESGRPGDDRGKALWPLRICLLSNHPHQPWRDSTDRIQWRSPPQGSSRSWMVLAARGPHRRELSLYSVGRCAVKINTVLSFLRTKQLTRLFNNAVIRF